MMTMLLARLATAAAAQGAEPPMNAEDPSAFHVSLAAMGLSPDKLDLSGSPSTLIKVRGDSYWVALGGCNDQKKSCRTVLVGSRFNDVKAVPLDWVNKQNLEFDLLKVWRTDEGELAYSVQAPAGGMTRANFRALIDGLVEAEGSLADGAKEAKLVKD